MSTPYDATSKELIETDPAGWVAFLGCAVSPSAVRLVDADLSTVTTDADKVIRVDEPERWLLHLEIQSSSDWEIERRLLRYNVLLHHRHGLPVATVVVLLRQSGDMKWVNGSLPIAPPLGPAWAFRYQVIRVWERPASDFLTGPLGLIPLAPLANVQETDLPATINEMRTRIDGQSDRPLAAKLWTATYLLMGLRFDTALINNVLSGVMQMEESVTYQAILRRGVEQGLREGRNEGRNEGRAEGRAEEAAKMLLGQARKKFGTPSAEQEAALRVITDLTRLEALGERLLDVNTWDEFLAPV